MICCTVLNKLLHFFVPPLSHLWHDDNQRICLNLAFFKKTFFTSPNMVIHIYSILKYCLNNKNNLSHNTLQCLLNNLWEVSTCDIEVCPWCLIQDHLSLKILIQWLLWGLYCYRKHCSDSLDLYTCETLVMLFYLLFFPPIFQFM